ncbi:hypothetical protein HDU98_002244 [Podochytrium sp. JEL0797]|nr:hypothetical protein HDU98_002244 [Podochytrium sp. JEL0797]
MLREMRMSSGAAAEAYAVAENFAVQGNYRASLDAYKKAYRMQPRDTDDASTPLWAAQCTATPADDAYLKTIQQEKAAPTHHRASAAFARGLVFHKAGNQEASAAQYRKVISLCEKFTPAERKEELLVSIDVANMTPVFATVQHFFFEDSQGPLLLA